MNDKEIGELFVKYMTAEMDLIDDEMMNYEHPPYSPRYVRRMKRLLKAGKSFGGHVVAYNVIRRVAIFVAIILSLAVANESSARILGINPWNMLITYISEYGMNREEYIGKKGVQNDLPTAVSDIPTFVPEGYSVYEEMDEGKYRFIEWRCLEDDAGQGISYDRIEIDSSSVSMTDNERDLVETTDVMGYLAKVYEKNDVETYLGETETEYEIAWNDEKYSYTITAIRIEDAKSTIKRMAESIYKKN